MFTMMTAFADAGILCRTMPESDKLIRYERVDYHRVKDAKSATITMSQDGSLFEASGAGNGAVSSVGDAIMKAWKERKYCRRFCSR